MDSKQPPKPLPAPGVELCSKRAALEYIRKLGEAYPGERVRQEKAEGTVDGARATGYTFYLRGVPVYRYLVQTGEGRARAWGLVELS